MRKNTKIFIGIDLGATRIKTGVFSGAKLLKTKTSFIKEEEKSEKKIIEKIKISTKEILKETEFEKISCIGIGVPGVICQKKGIITKSPNFPAWQNFPLASKLSKELGVRVILENDANVIALGEFFYGAARGVKNFLTLTLGSGVGGAIFLNGKLWRGVDGMAGEFGHITVEPEGFPCNCANRGCLEQYASLNGFKNFIMQDKIYGEQTETYASDPELSLKLYNSAINGDEKSLSYFQKMSFYLAIGISSLLNIFNVKLVLLCGGIAKSFSLFKENLFKEIEKRTFSAIFEGVEIKTGSLWENAGIYGACYLAKKGYLQSQGFS